MNLYTDNNMCYHNTTESDLSSRNQLIALRNKRAQLPENVALHIKDLCIQKRVRGKRAGQYLQRTIHPVITNRTQTSPVSRGICHHNLTCVKCIPAPPSNHKRLTVACVNTQSVCNKIGSFVDYVISSKLDICLLTETWIKEADSATKAAITPNGYVFKGCPRSGRGGGGTGFLCRTNMGLKQISSGERDSFEFSEWNVVIDNRRFIIVIVYRPPYSQQHPVGVGTFLTEFSEYLERIVLCNEPLLICGDFNIHVDVANDRDAIRFLDLLDSMGLENHIFFQTHESGHALDLLITRSSDGITIKQPIADCYISDHSFVKCFLAAPKPDLVVKQIIYRKYKSIDFEQFESDLSASLLCTQEFTDVEMLAKCYDETLSTLIDKHAPPISKTFVTRAVQPWFCDNIRDLKLKKKSLEKKWRKSKSDEDKKVFKVARNLLTNTIEQKRVEHFSNKVSECDGDQGKLFKLVNKLSGLSTENPLPDHSDPYQLANKFGQFFVTKVNTIQNKIDGICAKESLATEVAEEGECVSSFVSFEVLSQDAVLELIKKSPSKQCLSDPCPTWILKRCIGTLLPVITSLINLSLQSGVFPDSWKIAIIIPLLKKLGLELVDQNYRPVSNLQYISKLVERAAVVQGTEYAVLNQLLQDCMFAYRKYHSTETALIKMQSDVFAAMDKQHVTLLVMLDLSAAFDTVPHQDLLENTLHKRFGIGGTALSWFRSYLSGRKQQVLIGSQLSDLFDLDCGVPQGSCLGPILFTWYISSLYDVISQHLPKALGYADDNQLLLSFEPGSAAAEQDTVAAMEACIADVRKWMLQHRLLINDTKTEFMLLGTRQQLQKVTIDGIRVGDADIKPASMVKNLGVFQDPKLSMGQQVSAVCRRSFLQLYRLRKIRKYLSNDATQTLVHAFITSNLDYCNSLYTGMPAYLTAKLQRIQNAAARLVMQLPKFDHITGVMIELHWLPVADRIRYKVLLLTFKALHGMAPVYLTNMLCMHHSSHGRRSNKNLNLLKVPRTKRKTLGTRSFNYYAPTEWNKLPMDIRMDESIESFKSKVKTFLFKSAYNV